MEWCGFDMLAYLSKFVVCHAMIPFGIQEVSRRHVNEPVPVCEVDNSRILGKRINLPISNGNSCKGGLEPFTSVNVWQILDVVQIDATSNGGNVNPSVTFSHQEQFVVCHVQLWIVLALLSIPVLESIKDLVEILQEGIKVGSDIIFRERLWSVICCFRKTNSNRLFDVQHNTCICPGIAVVQQWFILFFTAPSSFIQWYRYGRGFKHNASRERAASRTAIEPRDHCPFGGNLVGDEQPELQESCALIFWVSPRSEALVIHGQAPCVHTTRKRFESFHNIFKFVYLQLVRIWQFVLGSLLRHLPCRANRIGQSELNHQMPCDEQRPPHLG
mmetsp:Transcript_5224/g.9274  ORF Transcript_5224/g.9274 Transcript_5224/m.9274 type:complete len:330 (-) Transcript_5224:44-1033(-)